MIQRNSNSEIGKKVTINETLGINDVKRFWETIQSEEKDFNENTDLIQNVKT